MSDGGIRNRMIEGTKVLWSTALYVPFICCAILIALLLQPLLAPYEVPLPERSWEKNAILAVVFWGAVLLASRFFVWKPLRQLYRDVGNSAAFRAHCIHIARLSVPFAPVMAVPIALLVFELGEWLIFLQLGAVLAADKLFDHHRQQPIADSVDALLSRI